MKNKVIIIAAGSCIIGVLLIAIALFIARKDHSMLNTNVKYDKLQYVCSSDVTSIEVEESSNEVFIKKGDVDKIVVDYYYDEKYLEYTFEEHDSTFTVKRVPKKLSISWGINIDFDWPKLILTVPEKEYDNIDVKLSSGSVAVSDLTVKNLKVKNSSGSLKIADVKGENVHVENTSGSLSVNGVQTTTLEADNSSGKINISDITASSLRAENTSGGIDIDNVNSSAISAKTSSGGLRIENTSCDTISGKSTSGNIKIESLDAATEIVLQASSGGIHGSIVGKAEDFSIITNTTSGSSNLQNGNGGSKRLNCETTSGNIKIDFVN